MVDKFHPIIRQKNFGGSTQQLWKGEGCTGNRSLVVKQECGEDNGAIEEGTDRQANYKMGVVFAEI